MLVQLHYRKKRARNGGGFTLIELLVVTAIITMLLSFAAAQFNLARVRQRDAEREQEVKFLQQALALYAVTHSRYPPANAALLPYASSALSGSDPVSQDLIQTQAIPSTPLDPINVGDYQYRYASGDGSTYEITYSLETDSIPGKTPANNPQRAKP